MKRNLIWLVVFVSTFLFVSCEREPESDKIGNFEFYIDSIYNITETSVTIQATLYTEKVEKRIIGLEISYNRTDDSSNWLYQSFNKKRRNSDNGYRKS